MTGASSQGGAITGINVTPLVDVTLVLLIIFMVTAKVVVRQHALPVDLPKAASGEQTQEIFSVVVLADGSIVLDGQKLADEAALLPAAEKALRANPDVRAVIQADGSVPHRRVMHVLDLLKQADIQKIGFGVVPGPAPAAAGR